MQSKQPVPERKTKHEFQITENPITITSGKNNKRFQLLENNTGQNN